MKRKGNIVRYTKEELDERVRRGEDQTDWERVDAMTEDELERAIADDPDWADVPRDWYRNAHLVPPRVRKKQITLRLDPEVVEWFKAQGAGYQSRINAVLRRFVEAKRHRPG